jgi:hypothetical protein
MEDTQGSYVRAAQRTPSNDRTRSLHFFHHTNTRPSGQHVVAFQNGGRPRIPANNEPLPHGAIAQGQPALASLHTRAGRGW